MPTVKKQGKMTESPQAVTRQMGTEVYGGAAPSKEAVIKSANARGGARHEVKSADVADVGNLRDTAHMAGNEMVGVKNDGYLVKKGLNYGVNAMYNSLPPGMDIEDQENCDIRKMELKTVTGLGFPGDGWNG
jgi:hypothetical protein